MARYRLQVQDINCTMVDTEVVFNTKDQLDDFIGTYGIDYDWRVGYTFKHYGRPVARFVWNIGSKVGQEVKVK
ncbi:hypothetical protein NVP1187O_167 [Vibrio phage 1.187.O._10N.286.49.F1]|nr:hypothetical protein NVP1187O_167 [Vibrio phage 1.187.O._10N.286.49.F1]